MYIGACHQVWRILCHYHFKYCLFTHFLYLLLQPKLDIWWSFSVTPSYLFLFSLCNILIFFSNLPSSNSALIYFSIIKVLFLFKICMVIGNLLLLTKTFHYLFYCLKIYLPIWLFNVFAGLIHLFVFVELLYVGIHAYQIIFNWIVSMGTFWDLGRGISPKEKKPLSGAWGHYPTYDHFEINCHFLKHIVNVTSSPKFMLGPLNGWDSHRWLLLFLGLHPW